MRLIVLAVGRLRPPYADDVQHYAKLLARHARLELVEVREDEQVARRVPERAFCSLLHRDGETFTSEGFAAFLEERRASGRDVCFVIGGAYGMDELPQAEHRFSLGPLTLPHQLGARGAARAALPRPQDPRRRALSPLTPTRAPPGWAGSARCRPSPRRAWSTRPTPTTPPLRGGRRGGGRARRRGAGWGGEIAAAFASDAGHPTPKVDVRGAVFDAAGRLLLVRERSDGGWTLPGGWADPGETAAESVAREVREESGVAVRVDKLVAVPDRDRQGHEPPIAFAAYKLLFLCSPLDGEPGDPDHEIAETGWFDPADPPQPLSLGRVSPAQLALVARHHADPGLPAVFD